MTVAQLRGFAPPELVVRPGETILLVGKPGTGKSTLAEWLMRGQGSAIVYDTKCFPHEQVAWERAGFARVDHPRELHTAGRALAVLQREWWQPGDRKVWDRATHPWTEALEHPYRRHPTFLTFDEVVDVMPATGSHPGTFRLLQQARAWGHVVIAGTQRPNRINTSLPQLCQHIVVLGPLAHRDVLKQLAEATGLPSGPVAALTRRQVAWWSQDEDRWHTFAPIDPQGPHVLVPLAGGRGLADPDVLRRLGARVPRGPRLDLPATVLSLPPSGA